MPKKGQMPLLKSLALFLSSALVAYYRMAKRMILGLLIMMTGPQPVKKDYMV